MVNLCVGSASFLLVGLGWVGCVGWAVAQTKEDVFSDSDAMLCLRLSNAALRGRRVQFRPRDDKPMMRMT